MYLDFTVIFVEELAEGLTRVLLKYAVVKILKEWVFAQKMNEILSFILEKILCMYVFVCVFFFCFFLRKLIIFVFLIYFFFFLKKNSFYSPSPPFDSHLGKVSKFAPDPLL